jgi:hypothetical protein
MNYYILKNKQMPWTEYGEVLYAGINVYDSETKNYYMSRTAPFVPCIYRDPNQPFLFVTDTIKRKLEQSTLTGFTFRQAIKDRIVSLAWETWNLSAPEPAVYPSGDMDAEEYILRRKHNELLADEMENIWAVIFPTKGFVSQEACPKLIEQTIGDADIFTAEINANEFLKEIIVSDKAMQWISEQGNECVHFEVLPTKIGTNDEIEKLQRRADDKRFRQEKSDKMTDKDWQLWHRLINESKKLLETIDTAKKEETKERWRKKAKENLLTAREMYPLQKRESENLDILLKDS